MLARTIAKHKEKITPGMVYQEYVETLQEVTRHGGSVRIKIDLLLMKKSFEELSNSNLIHIKHDDKYINCYELKIPLDELKRLILKLEENSVNFDNDMKSWITSINVK